MNVITFKKPESPLSKALSRGEPLSKQRKETFSSLKFGNHMKSDGVSFGGSYSYNLKTAKKLMERLAAENIESSTMMAFKLEEAKFSSPLEQALFNIRANYTDEKIKLIREYSQKVPVESFGEYASFQEKLVMKLKAGNCAEMALILNRWLTRAGIDSFHGTTLKIENLLKLHAMGAKTGDKAIDDIARQEIAHDLVVVSTKRIPGDMIPIEDLIKTKDVFIADPWLNKIFETVEEALDVYKAMFGVQKHDMLGVVSRLKKDAGKGLTKAQKKEGFEHCISMLDKKIQILQEIYRASVKKIQKDFQA